MRQVLFGPASPTFRACDLGRSACAVLFDMDGNHELKLSAGATWAQLVRGLPVRFCPDVLVLQLAYKTIPVELWNAPVPIIGLAPDWNLLWSVYRHQLPRCDAVLTDALGVKCLRRSGIEHVYQANLFGLERDFVTRLPETMPDRDIDVLFVGNCQAAVQGERLRWLGRIGRLANRYHVVIRHGVFGDEYRNLMCRSRIVFNRGVRRECNQRAFEAIACRALLFQERENQELPKLLCPGREYIEYGEDDLLELIDDYLNRTAEREAIVDSAHSRLDEFTQAAFWERAWHTLDQHAEAVEIRRRKRCGSRTRPSLAAGLWQAVSGGDGSELMRALEDSSAEADRLSALGVLAPTPSDAATHFRKASQIDPGNVVTRLNLVESLARAGQLNETIAEARLGLEWLARENGLSENALDAPHYPPGFELIRIEWERSGWVNAGDSSAEHGAKRTLVECWLRFMLGSLSDDLGELESAWKLRPDLGALKFGLACAYARRQRFEDALPLLRQAVNGDPFDRMAARSLYQLLSDLGRLPELAEFQQEQLILHRAAKALVPPEIWFEHPRLSGRERSSIIVLGCNQVVLTRLCLESVCRSTDGDYELILIDNGSTDDTPTLFEEMRSRPGPSRVEVIHNAHNRGFAAGVNQGLAAARGEFLVFLNNDTVVTSDWLAGLIRCSLQDWPFVGLVGPTTNYTRAPQLVTPGYADLSGLDQFAASRRELYAGRALDVSRLTGFCLLIRRTVLEKLGGQLDEEFGHGFFEDDDLSMRARQAGFKLCVAEDVYIHHFGSSTFAALGIDTEKQLEQNFQLFKRKWGEDAAAGYRIQANLSQRSETPNDHFVSNGPASNGPGPAAPAERAPKVSLCMMVKNEESNLADCLGPLRDVVDEIVIVDTGSTDRTMQLAEALGARVFQASWQDSFSAARNASIEHACGQWIFWMDADDRIDAENVAKLKTLFATLDRADRAFVMKCVCVPSTLGESATIVDHVRLFKNDPRLRWTFRVHEQILPSIRATNSEVIWSDVVIEHVGYTDASLRRRKLERDLRLLELERLEQPDNAFTLFNAGSVLREMNRPKEALPLLLRSLERSHPHDSIVRKLYSMIAQIHFNLEAIDLALEVLANGRAIYPTDGELLFLEGLVRQRKGDRRGAEANFRALIAGKDEQCFASVASGLRGYKARHNLALIYLEEKRFSEAEAQWQTAVIEEPNFLAAQVGIAEVHAQSRAWDKLDRQIEALRRYGPRGDEEGAAFVGRSLLERDMLPAAADHLQQAIARYPNSVYLRVLLSHAFLRAGSDHAAEAALRLVLALAPDHAEARNNLAVILNKRDEHLRRATGRIFVLCPDNPAPSGGIRKLYRHVDVLVASGYAAAIIHTRAGFRCRWFENDTPVTTVDHVALSPSDFLVVPEIYGPLIEPLAPGVPKVVFNQNAYYTFRGWPIHGLEQCPYRRQDVIATITVSEDNYEYLRYAFPEINLHRVHYGIDPRFTPSFPKRRQIAFMPRKNAEDAHQVLNLLHVRSELRGWEVVSLDNLSEAEVASALRNAAIFLSFGHPEGCPLPPMEAMASGCVVIGYHGRGGREYFDPEFTFPIETGDIVGFAKKVEHVLRMAKDCLDSFEQLGQRASEYIRLKYSVEQEAHDIKEFWAKITTREGRDTLDSVQKLAIG